MTRPEVQAASKWWAGHLRGLTDDERRRFAASLAVRLETHVVAEWAHAVERHDPQWGSFSREIAMDFAPDPLLLSALIEALGPERAHEMALGWPTRTTMRMNPGRVTIVHGYDGIPEDVYRGAET